jgi:hypothetical protein
MKKFFLGILIGAALACFGILFSGCNHHHKYFATETIKEVPGQPAPTAPAPDVNVTVDVSEITSDIFPTLPCECWPPGHCKGKWHHWKHSHNDDCDDDCDEESDD